MRVACLLSLLSSVAASPPCDAVCGTYQAECVDAISAHAACADMKDAYRTASCCSNLTPDPAVAGLEHVLAAAGTSADAFAAARSAVDLSGGACTAAQTDHYAYMNYTLFTSHTPGHGVLYAYYESQLYASGLDLMSGRVAPRYMFQCPGSVLFYLAVLGAVSIPSYGDAVFDVCGWVHDIVQIKLELFKLEVSNGMDMFTEAGKSNWDSNFMEMSDSRVVTGVMKGTKAQGESGMTVAEARSKIERLLTVAYPDDGHDVEYGKLILTNMEQVVLHSNMLLSLEAGFCGGADDAWEFTVPSDTTVPDSVLSLVGAARGRSYVAKEFSGWGCGVDSFPGSPPTGAITAFATGIVTEIHADVCHKIGAVDFWARGEHDCVAPKSSSVVGPFKGVDGTAALGAWKGNIYFDLTTHPNYPAGTELCGGSPYWWNYLSTYGLGIGDETHPLWDELMMMSAVFEDIFRLETRVGVNMLEATPTSVMQDSNGAPYYCGYHGPDWFGGMYGAWFDFATKDYGCGAGFPLSKGVDMRSKAALIPKENIMQRSKQLLSALYRITQGRTACEKGVLEFTTMHLLCGHVTKVELAVGVNGSSGLDIPVAYAYDGTTYSEADSGVDCLFQKVFSEFPYSASMWDAVTGYSSPTGTGYAWDVLQGVAQCHA